MKNLMLLFLLLHAITGLGQCTYTFDGGDWTNGVNWSTAGTGCAAIPPAAGTFDGNDGTLIINETNGVPLNVPAVALTDWATIEINTSITFTGLTLPNNQATVLQGTGSLLLSDGNPNGTNLVVINDGGTLNLNGAGLTVTVDEDVQVGSLFGATLLVNANNTMVVVGELGDGSGDALSQYTVNGTLTAGTFSPGIDGSGLFAGFTGVGGTGIFDFTCGHANCGNVNCNPDCPAGPLPIELLAFSSTRTKQGVLLKWTTATELNNDHFQIERKLLDGEATVIGTVPGSGTTQEVRSYSYLDPTQPTSNTLYRLVQYDFDGANSSTAWLEVLPEQVIHYSVVQNPVRRGEAIQLQLGGTDNQAAHIVLLDLNSGRIASQRVEQLGGSNLLTLPTDGLSGGLYLVQTTIGSQVFTSRVLVSE